MAAPVRLRSSWLATPWLLLPWLLLQLLVPAASDSCAKVAASGRPTTEGASTRAAALRADEALVGGGSVGALGLLQVDRGWQARGATTKPWTRGPVVVAGATGRTGSLVYQRLAEHGVPVRGLVRNASKAREVLACSACNQTEGIYVGDVRNGPEALTAAMQGAATLVVATASEWVCTYPKAVKSVDDVALTSDRFPRCAFAKGESPYDIDWLGSKALLEAFAEATAGQGHVLFVSMMQTTEPEDDDYFGHISFYKLQFEAELMASGLPFTIAKPCYLYNREPGEARLRVGHDDAFLEAGAYAVARADVARVLVAAVELPTLASGLRFDLCAFGKGSKPTADDRLAELLYSAQFPWNQVKTLR